MFKKQKSWMNTIENKKGVSAYEKCFPKGTKFTHFPNKSVVLYVDPLMPGYVAGESTQKFGDDLTNFATMKEAVEHYKSLGGKN